MTHYAVLLLFYSTFWLIVVAGNLGLSLLLSSIVMFVIVRYLGDLFISRINDKSQFAKVLLMFGQAFEFIAGLLIIFEGKGYYVSKKALAESDSAEHAHLNVIQEEGISTKQ